MSYRDDLDAAHARVQALEQELARTKAELAAARGEPRALVAVGDQALVRGAAGSPAVSRWLGAPTQLQFVRTLDGELPEAAHTELVERMREAIGAVGTTTVLPGSLAWATAPAPNTLSPAVNVYVTSRGGQTTIRAEQKMTQTLAAIFGGVGGGVGGGAIMLPGSVAFVAPWLLPVTIGVWLGGVYAAYRRLYRGRVRKHAATLEAMVDDLARIAAEHIARPPDVGSGAGG